MIILRLENGIHIVMTIQADQHDLDISYEDHRDFLLRICLLYYSPCMIQALKMSQ